MNALPRRATRSRISAASLLVWASYVFLVIGILAIGYAGYVLASARAYQAIETARLERIVVPQPEVRREVSPVAVGSVLGQLEIPRIKLSVIVVQGDSSKLLRRAVGHLPATALPGEPGNVALAGHRDTFFRPLRHIQPGDDITLRTQEGDFHYRVDSTRVVPPTATEVLRSSGVPELTLITCFPFNYIGAAPDRFIVRAKEVDSPAN
ncbi:MAG TPA: class D sortase [Candidatus Polarisedimenticolia bacterium]|nr:class D sortase [Candidatus Polarisedimenticolia bacterium]